MFANKKSNINGIDMVKMIPEIMEEGKLKYVESRDSYVIEHNGHMVVVRPNMYDDNKIKWIITAYEINKT